MRKGDKKDQSLREEEKEGERLGGGREERNDKEKFK